MPISAINSSIGTIRSTLFNRAGQLIAPTYRHPIQPIKPVAYDGGANHSVTAQRQRIHSGNILQARMDLKPITIA